MGTMNINVYGREYPIACDDGQEAHLGQLTHMVNARVQELMKDMGRAPEHTMLIYTALMLADELLDVTRAYQRLETSMEKTQANTNEAANSNDEMESAMAAHMEQIAGRLGKLADQLEQAA